MQAWEAIAGDHRVIETIDPSRGAREAWARRRSHVKKHGKRWRELARSAGDEGDQTTKTLDTGMGHGRPQEAEAGESTRMDR